MNWLVTLLTTLAAVGAAFYIAAPFYRESSLRAPAGAPLRARQRELELQREALLRELKELEFDRRMGKVEAEQYASARANATRQAGLVLRQIEALSSPTAPASAARRARSAQAGRARLELEIELEVAVVRERRRRALAQDAGWACACGRVMQSSDHFCGSCGQAMPEAASVARAGAGAV